MKRMSCTAYFGPWVPLILIICPCHPRLVSLPGYVTTATIRADPWQQQPLACAKEKRCYKDPLSRCRVHNLRWLLQYLIIMMCIITYLIVHGILNAKTTSRNLFQYEETVNTVMMVTLFLDHLIFIMRNSYTGKMAKLYWTEPRYTILKCSMVEVSHNSILTV